MAKTVTLTVRMTEEISRDLEALARATERTKSWHAEKALIEYLAKRAEEVAPAPTRRPKR